MATEGTIGAAYINGRRAAERNESIDNNPYYGRPNAPVPEEEYDAWRSGWIDRTDQLKKLRPAVTEHEHEDEHDQPDVGDIDIDPAHRV